jgi:hypothetical protein
MSSVLTRTPTPSPAGRASTTGGSPSRAARAALGLLVIVVLTAGVWGVTAPRAHEHASTGAGEAVPFPGGLVTVDRVNDVDLSMPMTGPGMAMQSQGVPSIPEGSRRFEVDVTIRAEDRPLQFDPTAFTVHGTGVPATPPIAHDEGGTLIPAGGMLTRTVMFEVPEDAEELAFSVLGGTRTVDLHLGSAPGGDHGH